MGFFPRSAAADEKMFLAGLVELLSSYPEWVVNQASNVRSGLPAHFAFMPSIAEIKGFCDTLLDDAVRHQQVLDRYKPQALPPPAKPHTEEDKERVAQALANFHRAAADERREYILRDTRAKQLGAYADKIAARLREDLDREFGA